MQNEIIVKDEIKGMSYGKKVIAINGHISIIVESEIKRDPGTPDEIVFPKTQETVQLPINGGFQSQEELSAFLKEQPMAGPIIDFLLKQATAPYVFKDKK